MNLNPLGFPEPSFDPPAETTDDGFSDLPTFPPMEEDNSALSTEEDLPSLPTSETTDPLPPLSAPDLPADDSLPVLPSEDADDLPALPGLDEPSSENNIDSGSLPGLPEESDGGGYRPYREWRMKVVCQPCLMVKRIILVICLLYHLFPKENFHILFTGC